MRIIEIYAIECFQLEMSVYEATWSKISGVTLLRRSKSDKKMETVYSFMRGSYLVKEEMSSSIDSGWLILLLTFGSLLASA